MLFVGWLISYLRYLCLLALRAMVPSTNLLIWCFVFILLVFVLCLVCPIFPVFVCFVFVFVIVATVLVAINKENDDEEDGQEGGADAQRLLLHTLTSPCCRRSP